MGTPSCPARLDAPSGPSATGWLSSPVRVEAAVDGAWPPEAERDLTGAPVSVPGRTMLMPRGPPSLIASSLVVVSVGFLKVTQ
jgi:hypothetical protein